MNFTIVNQLFKDVLDKDKGGVQTVGEFRCSICIKSVLKLRFKSWSENVSAVDSVADLVRKILIVSNDDNEDNFDNFNDAIDSNYVNDVTNVWNHFCVMYLAYRLAILGDEARKHVRFNETLPMVFSESRRLRLDLTKLLLRSGDIESNPGPVPNAFSQVANDVTSDGGQGPDVHVSVDDDGDFGGEVVVVHQGALGIEQRLSSYEGENFKQTKVNSDLQVMTLNVRGLGCPKKVRHLVNTCYKRSKAAGNSFYLFQETYVTKLDLLRYLWRGEHYVTAGTGNSLGCITLVTAPYKIVRAVDLGQRGHALALTKDDINKVDIILANAYAPNGFDAEKRAFFEEINDSVTDLMNVYNCRQVILGGDLNLVFKDAEVKNREITNAEKRIASDVKQMFEQNGLTDSWDDVVEPGHTWTSSRTGIQAFSTLDRLFYSKASLNFVNQIADWSVSISDHAAVIANFSFVNSGCHKTISVPRLDPRVLMDPEGTKELNDVFREMFEQRSHEWTPHVSLEYVKMCIRTSANVAIGRVKAKYRDEERGINSSLNFVIGELSRQNVSRDERELLMHKLDDLRQLKRSLIERIGSKLERATARRWYNEGELSSKYFFNLLTRKVNNEVKSIIKDNGVEISEASEIETEIRDFYKQLYETVPNELDNDDVIFRNIEPLPQDEARRMVERLNVEELERTLKTCSDSAPGPDGIPYSYLKHFWQSIGPIIVDAWNYSLDTNQLPPSHKVSYLRLIPKAGKDSRVIANLRPITLSNTDHKLITKTYAKKLTDLVACKIGSEQTAYIPGRLINDNVRAMLTTIDLANDDAEVDGLVVSLDAKKAFDSVDHRFIRRCLTAFGLSCFIPIFNTLYKDLSSEIILNGRTISGYRILKGVKQGDALSCILFIICMEPLIRNIKNNQMVEPITSVNLPILIPKIYSYADDISVVTKRSRGSIQGIFSEYEKFSKNSGLILNADKTEVLCFNNAREINHDFEITYLGDRFRLQGQEQVKINGILFRQDPDERETHNVNKVIKAMEKHLSAWSSRHLTLLGRILIIKTFAVSQVIYLLQTMVLKEVQYKSIMKLIYKYLWNRNFNGARAPERLKRSIMLTPVSMGGFGLIDLKDLGESLDLRSYGRLLKSNHPFLGQIGDLIDLGNFFTMEINHSVDRKTKVSIDLMNRERRKILNWPVDRIVGSSSLVTSKMITRQGRQSLTYFMIQSRQPNVLMKQVMINDFNRIERFLVHPELGRILRALLTMPNRVETNAVAKEVYPTRSMNVTNVSCLTSKEIRTALTNDEDKIICLYKIGVMLDPGEVCSWTGRLKKLTSTRHRNILLRTVHGDFFSNSRLCKFGLREGSGCANCPEPVETVQHRINECPKAIDAWLRLDEAKRQLGLRPLIDFSLENLIGAKERLTKVELALNAELILKLSTKGEGYCPAQLVKATIKLIGNSEPLKGEVKDRFKAYPE